MGNETSMAKGTISRVMRNNSFNKLEKEYANEDIFGVSENKENTKNSSTNTISTPKLEREIEKIKVSQEINRLGELKRVNNGPVLKERQGNAYIEDDVMVRSN
jgi:hypothetical protein